jgi:hypothetical protein
MGRVTEVRAMQNAHGFTELHYKLNGLVDSTELPGYLSVGQIKRFFHKQGHECSAKHINLRKYVLPVLNSEVEVDVEVDVDVDVDG